MYASVAVAVLVLRPQFQCWHGPAHDRLSDLHCSHVRSGNQQNVSEASKDLGNKDFRSVCGRRYLSHQRRRNRAHLTRHQSRVPIARKSAAFFADTSVTLG
ncbi:hypothetical protein XFF7767_80190 [Xanthomonas citri pv. fuscans]|nr:hypothetical protein XFF6960_590019 [Xanthomonas citri pv. fuscans]SOO06780.1 hypothetical protein XFF7767_80190 [Xanthomonas citri pv. fuscans]SOO11100.1 hypothetical protein XFF6970_70029 [Xanthomonas citri pv. fuscans]SOO16335.1 hypothetical protein XFF7766_770189 [Xanthomonas citri pv. fuscans]SOO45782.1 hypothetical protein XFF1815_900121 [Xanthomonas citri pv. fuscans]